MHALAARTLSHILPATAAVAVLLLAADGLLQRDPARLAIALGLAAVALASSWRRALPVHCPIAPIPAPQVAHLLHEDQAEHADINAEISVICADIRNFTRFSAQTPTADAMQFLREYYAAVGDAVARHGGTIKDYAGDGVLVLVGAPTPMADHATRAIDLANAIREAALAVTARWTSATLELGIGIGVASGDVTLGVVGGAGRREYAAVGTPVNLAARLCSRAASGEILLDVRAGNLASEHHDTIRAGAALDLKGFDTPVASLTI